jgi:hypothetical protein
LAGALFFQIASAHADNVVIDFQSLANDNDAVV